MSDDVEIQWRVTYFPPDRKEVVRTGTERQVRKIAQGQEPWHPIIETRTIVISEWEEDPGPSVGERVEADE